MQQAWHFVDSIAKIGERVLPNAEGTGHRVASVKDSTSEIVQSMLKDGKIDVEALPDADVPDHGKMKVLRYVFVEFSPFHFK